MADLLPVEDRKSQLPPLAETGWTAVPDRDAIRKILKFRSLSLLGFMSRRRWCGKAEPPTGMEEHLQRGRRTLTTHDCEAKPTGHDLPRHGPRSEKEIQRAPAARTCLASHARKHSPGPQRSAIALKSRTGGRSLLCQAHLHAPVDQS